MNKKGFASSTIIYGLLSVFLIAISILICTMNSNVRLNRTLNEKTVENIEYGSSSLSELENRITELEGTIINKIYPVGSVYISTTDDTVEKVQERFGGTWEKYSEGRTLIGEGTGTDKNGNVATFRVEDNDKNLGEYLHTLTTSEIPSHTHVIPVLSVSSWSGNHYHSNNAQHLRFYGNGDVVNLGTSGSNNGWDITRISANNLGDGRLMIAPWDTNSTSITVSGQKTTESNTTTCTNCGGTSFNVQDPYIVTYMYKRIK